MSASIKPIRHYEFGSYLQRVILDLQGDHCLTIGLRVDGEPTDANVILKKVGTTEYLRVGINGGEVRVDTWNVVGMILETLLGQGHHFPNHVQKLYAQTINQVKRGYVLLTVRSGGVIERAEFAASL